MSPCWSQDYQDQTGLAWQPALSQYPHRNRGKPVQTLPGLEASPAATSLEHWVLKQTTQTLIYTYIQHAKNKRQCHVTKVKYRNQF